MRLATWVLAAVCLLAAGRVLAYGDDETEKIEKSSYRIVLDRVEHEPSAVGGNRLRVYVSALSLGGQLLDLTEPKSIKLTVGNAELKEPFALGRYGATDAQTALVIVVQATIEYADTLKVLVEALDMHTLAALDEATTQVAVLPYGESLATAKLTPLKPARAALTALQNDGTASEPVLLDSIERALALLKKAKGAPEGIPLRKVIVVIGDGRDLSGDRERVTRLGERAAKEGVRIHSFGYAPNDIRRPLLLLGELSKRSLGTFRWIRSGNASSWAPAFQQLRDELLLQYVLTYFLPADTDVGGKKLKLEASGRATAASLNELKIPHASCAGEPCETGYCTGTRCVVVKRGGGRGLLGWILLMGGIVAGALVILAAVGYVMSKRAHMQAVLAGEPNAFPPARAVQAPKAPKPPKPPKAPKPPKPVKVASIPPPGSIPPAATLPSQPPAVTGPRLYILSGPRTGEEIALRHGFMIGKQANCDLVIDDGFTSSHHAQIGMDHFGNCRVYDRGSTNGTFVNGQRVTEYVLDHGTSIKIGSTELRFLAQ